MESDRDLLSLYAKEGRQAAFAEVVRRHTDFVYSTALRLVAGDTHLAQDVSQTVFTALANKAASLAHHDSLLGWLHTATRYAASDAVRRERRRRTREQESSTMNDNLSASEPNWAQLQPLLDEAVGRLRVQDREAVLLRFFHSQTHREVGATLGLDETLVRKRVDRALEKMRAFLSRRGVTTTSALLATAITTHSVHAAPAGLATTLGSTSLAQAAKLGIMAKLLHGFTMTSKTKTAVAAAVLVIIAAIPITLQSRQTADLQKQNDDLARQNITLKNSLDQLNAELENVVSKIPAKGATYMPVPLSVIKSLNFQVTVDDHTGVQYGFQFYDPNGILGLTPMEIKGTQAVLDELRQRVGEYERKNFKEIAPESVPDILQNRVAESQRINGMGYASEIEQKRQAESLLNTNRIHSKFSAYEIPSMSEAANRELQQWFLAAMTRVMGATRAQIILEKCQDRDLCEGLWLIPRVHYLIIFADTEDAQGVTHSSREEFNDNGGGGILQEAGRTYLSATWTPFLKTLRPNLVEPAPVPKS